MNKYEVKVVIPMLNKTYEVLVPNNILVGNFLYMLINSLNELINVNINNVKLYNSIDGVEIDLDSYVFKNIQNGSKVILI